MKNYLLCFGCLIPIIGFFCARKLIHDEWMAPDINPFWFFTTALFQAIGVSFLMLSFIF